jgi:hypothetical protein
MQWLSFCLRSNPFIPLGLTALLVINCTSIGPTKLVSSHEGYNDAVQLAQTREILSNIVRLRFGDPVQFLGVQSITAQFSVTVNASTTLAGATDQPVGVGFSDSPTITFAPRGDSKFQREFHAPMNLDQAVMRMLRGDLLDTELFTLFTSGINEAPDTSGPDGDLYRQRVAAIVALFKKHGTVGMRKSYDYISIVPIPHDKVRARDHILAAKQNQVFIESPDGKGLILGYRYLAAVIKLIDPTDENAHKQLRTLGVRPGLSAYEINSSSGVQVEGRGDEAIFLSLRSLADVMAIVARNVEIPPELNQSGRVPPPRYLDRTGSDVRFKMLWSKTRPSTPYAISSRGYWFYIDPVDYVSMGILDTLNTLFYSQVGSQAEGAAPVLSLPLGN